MLSEARKDLEPRQWGLLNTKLLETEQAFARFNEVAQASGKIARVARGAEAAAEAGRTGEMIEGVGSASSAGPLLMLLILLWPSETAGPAHDHGPDWLPPEKQELEKKLRELSMAGQQVKSELEAARRAPAREPEEAVRRYTDKPPQLNRVEVNWDWQPSEPKAPRYLPCRFWGHGGPGPFRPENAPLDWIRCTYTCGRYEVYLYDIRLKKDRNGKPKDAQAICEEWTNLKRAEEYARSKDDALKARGK